MDEVERLKKVIDQLEEEKSDLLEELAHCKNREELSRLVIDHFTDGLILLNEHHRLELINPTAANMIRVRAEEIQGKEILGMENDQIASLWTFANNALPSQKQHITLSEEAIVEGEIIPITYDEKKYKIIVLHDVTRETALKELKGEFVSVAAHQMRTPLSAIKWAFEIALGALDPKSDQALAVRRGHESAGRMLEIVNSLLDVDRIESGRFDYRFQKMELGEFIRLYVEEVASEKALVHSVRLGFQNKAGGPVLIQGDAEKFRLILQSLIENSLKYTPQGGEVRVTLSKIDHEAIVEVSDTGIGIPEEAQKHLFEKFFRAENAKRQVADGSGLGLYIVKRIAEAHGGDVAFKSKQDKGTTFYVTIPLFKA